MTQLHREDIKQLIGQEAAPQVSIYLPTHRAGAESQQDPIRFKNLLAEAAKRLQEWGLRRAEVETLLAPAQALLRDPAFWRYRQDGLAVFLVQGEMRTYTLPLDFPELVIVDDTCYVKPLLPMLIEDGQYYLLTLSQKQVRLFHGTRSGLYQLDLAELPEGLAELMAFDVVQRHLQVRTSAAPAAGQASESVYHGQGTPDDVDARREALLRYLRRIDSALAELNTAGEARPLVIAAVDYLQHQFRSISRYPLLVEGGISGNPDSLRASELHAAAWALVEPHFEAQLEQALERYRSLSASERTTTVLSEIVPAAQNARVDTLFVQAGKQRWGVYDPATQTVSLDQAADDQPAQDLLNLAAIHTLTNGGTVYVTPEETLPELAAAVLRF